MKNKLGIGAIFATSLILAVGILAQSPIVRVADAGGDPSLCSITTDVEGFPVVADLVIGPTSSTVTSISGDGTTITFTVDRECLIKNTDVGDVATVGYAVSATCDGAGTTPCPPDTVMGAAVAAVPDVNKSGGSVTGVTQNNPNTFPSPDQIVFDDPEIIILDGSAELAGFPPTNPSGKKAPPMTVAQLGTVLIDISDPYPDVTVGFSIAFKK